MEINRKRKPDSRLIAGILLVTAGALLLFERGLYLDFSIWDIVAVIAVGAGTIQIVYGRKSSEYREGTWWILMGAWFYCSVNHIFGFGFGHTWPIVLIIVGINELWKSFERKRNYIPAEENKNVC